jgi:hypothetical protein
VSEKSPVYGILSGETLGLTGEIAPDVSEIGGLTASVAIGIFALRLRTILKDTLPTWTFMARRTFGISGSLTLLDLGLSACNMLPVQQQDMRGAAYRDSAGARATPAVVSASS